MAEPFVGEIKITPYSFALKDWAYCDGQLELISQNQTLFSLLGTIYGGDGRNTYGLPDLRGRAPMGAGAAVQQGMRGGLETVTLSLNELPRHNHQVIATTNPASSARPSPPDKMLLAEPNEFGVEEKTYAEPPSPTSNPVTLHPAAVTTTGGGGYHDNCQPSLVVGFIIAMQGYYPPRN